MWSRVPDRCIVLEEGRLIGFFDVTVPPRWTPRKGGDEIFPSGEPVSEVRSLVAKFPERVPVQTVFSLLVSLSASSTVATGATLPLVLPLGTRVDIYVQPGRGFALAGESDGTLLVTDEEETLPFQFKLRGVAIGTGHIRVLAFHRGQALGKLTVSIDVLEAEANTSSQLLNEEQPLEAVRVHQPDLSLLILEHTDFGHQHSLFVSQLKTPR